MATKKQYKSEAQHTAEEFKIQCTRIHRVYGEQTTKAFVDISVMDVIVINGLRVVEGKDGLFVTMPRETGKDGKWYTTVIPLTRAVKDAIEYAVLTTYEG